MQVWRGDGHADGLTGRLLKHYINKPPLGARRPGNKRDPPARYRSWSVVRRVGAAAGGRTLQQVAAAVHRPEVGVCVKASDRTSSDLVLS